MQAAAAGVHRYPDHEPTELARALAARLDVPEQRIVFGNGSSELLVAAVQVALRDGDEPVIPLPCFPLFEKSIVWQRCRAVGVLTGTDGTLDVPAMLRAIGPRCKILFAPTPTHPTAALRTVPGAAAPASC